jgi:hypothetical protein
MFHHRLASEPILPIILPKAKIQVFSKPIDSLTWFTILDDWTMYGVNRPLRIEENRFNYQFDAFHINETLQYSGKNIETATEKEFSDKITDILIQTLLYFQLNKKELELVKTSTHSPSSSDSTKQKLNPIIIGSNYQAKAQTSVEKVTTGTRKSPITHWRRGFYRWQPYGSKEQAKYKLNWIEPVLVKG